MRRTLMLLSTLALALLVPSGLAHAADGVCLPSGSDVVCTFTYTGKAQSWTVPAGITQATFEVYGAQGGREADLGGSSGGFGGKASATDVAVSPGETLQVNVGGAGSPGQVGGAGGAGGFNGGAAGGNGPGSGPGGGGGASDVRSGGIGLANRIIVAGGGGGAGGNGNGFGGFGGGSGFASDPRQGGKGGDGGAGGAFGGFGGGGGLSSRGGFGGDGEVTFGNDGGDGVFGTGGSGGTAAGTTADGGAGGGGGGGYFGGGGGGSGSPGGGGGGGGSGFGPSGVVFQSGVRQGNGQVTITYTEPVAYTVDRSDDPDLSTTPTAGNCTAAANDCSLRGAITAANSSSGSADTIVFDLDSPATITLDSSLGQLPSITDAPPGLTIDGGTLRSP